MEISSHQEADLTEMLSQIVPLPISLQQRIAEDSVIQILGRKQLLLRPGETAKSIYFIRRGLLRSYYYDQSGKEYTSWFMEQGDFVLSNYSFLTQKPSYEYIETLQDCVLQSISWNQLNSYYADFKEGNFVGRIVSQKHYLLSEARAVLLRTTVLEDRYNLLLQSHAKIEQQTTQNHIASYLGISRETLSRIRRRKLKMCQQT